MEDQNQVPNQPPYQAPYQNPYQNQQTLTVGDWFVTVLVAAIPLVGLIMLFVWGFSSDTNPNKANWAKAMLIWMAIVIVLYIIIFATVGAALFSAYN
jgi:heme/copper-type cytochrome/quinol oxidase subunit 2